jgi:hypothetical protein
LTSKQLWEVKRLLTVVSAQKIDGQPRRSSRPMLVAGVMDYAALRPEEAAAL